MTTLTDDLVRHPHSAVSYWAALRSALRLWRSRRRARRELSRIDARTLADAGISLAAANYEISQPFWRPHMPLRDLPPSAPRRRRD
jgi:uncharacterized protein YjiS (DUF1127 family)